MLNNLFLILINFAVTGTSLRLFLPQDIKMSKYIGTWEGNTPDGTFKIVLKEKKNFLMPNGKTYNVIIGKHSYISNKSKVKNESISKSDDNFVLFSIPEISNSVSLPMTFTDNINHKILHISLTLLSDNKALQWKVDKETETFTINSIDLPVKGVSIPTDLIMKKIN